MDLSNITLCTQNQQQSMISKTLTISENVDRGNILCSNLLQKHFLDFFP